MRRLYLCLDCAHEWVSSDSYGSQCCNWCQSNNIKILEGQSLKEQEIDLIHKIVTSEALPDNSFGREVQLKIINHSKN